MQSEEAQPPIRMSIGAMLAVYVLAWVTGVQLIFWFGNLFKLRSMIESFVYPALVVAVLAMPGVRVLWTKTGLAARCAAGGLVLLMINAQLLRKTDATYPLCAWTMYGSKKPVPLQFMELAGVGVDGVRFRLNIEGAVSYPRAFVSLAYNVLDGAEKGRGTDPEKARADLAALDNVLAELGRHHARMNKETDVVRVEMVCVYLSSAGERLREELVRSVALSPSPGGGVR